MIKVGSLAPLTVQLKDQNDRPVSLQQHLGKPVILYFYPKDETPGCTTEACSFRDVFSEITATGAVVIGVSADSTSSHQKFKLKHQLPFDLWSDPDHQLLAEFGVWQQKNFMGKLIMGIVRSTFVIDKKGYVQAVWPKVNPQTHAAEILQFLKSI